MKDIFIKIFAVVHLLVFSAVLQTWAEEPGEPPMPNYPAPIVVGEMFQFTEGAWAEYEIFDKGQNTEFTLRMSILDSQQVRPTWLSRKRPYRWMEFDVDMPDQPRVVVKYLARETPEGPGEPHEVIVQIEECENPLRLGRMWLRSNDEEVVNDDYVWTRKQVDEERITHGGRTFSAWRVQAKATDGTTVEAVVSDELPPFGLYFVETPEQRMALRDWGMDARSSITGKPLGLFRWVARQVNSGLEEAPSEAQSAPPAPSPSPTPELSEHTSFDTLRERAEAGDAEAQLLLARRYAHGKEVVQNEKVAAEWIQRSANRGNAEAQWLLGMIYKELEYGGIRKDVAQAAVWLRRAAEQGQQDAQIQLGYMYNKGLGVPKDDQQAVEWFRRAANQGHPPGEYIMGAVYEYGRGVPKDARWATEWYRRAAEHGDVDAQRKMGRAYERGLGVNPNRQEAMKWYRMAAEQEDTEARKALERLSRHGD